MEAGLVSVGDLQNPEFGGGPISARVYHESRRSHHAHDLRVIDSSGRGIDMAIFHTAVAAQPASLDLGRLNAICGTQIEKT